MSDPRIAIAFGGGGARGLAHVHIIRALEELGVFPVAISGTSIGSIMGAGFASGMSSDEIEDYVISNLDNPTRVFSRFWSMRPSNVSELLAGPRTMLGNIDPVKTMKAFLPPQIPAGFDGLKRPLQIVATDFYGQSQVVIDRGDLYEAIAASCALPAIFRPVVYKGATLVDGGIVNSVPYELLFDKADIVVAVDVVGGPKRSEQEWPSRIEALSGASQLMMRATTRLKLEISPPDVFIVPPVDGVAALDFLRARAILDSTVSAQEMAKRSIQDAIENWNFKGARAHHL